MSGSSTIFVGLDQHKASIAVAYVGEDRSLETIYLRPIGTRTSDIDAMVRRLQAKGKKLVFACNDVLTVPPVDIVDSSHPGL